MNNNINLYQNRYFKTTLFMVIFSALMVIIGIISLKFVIIIPIAIITVLEFYMYAHLLHFLFGIYLIIQYVLIKKRQEIEYKITKAIIGLVLSPVSAVLAFTGFFMLALTNCAAN